MSAQVETVVEPSIDAVAEFVATRIADGIAAAHANGAEYVLGVPSGRTPLPAYRRLHGIVAERRLPLRHLRVALMDDYALPTEDGSFQNVPMDAHNSCRRFVRDEILLPLGRVAADGPLYPDQLLQPDPTDPAAYDEMLRDRGGIDCFVLASGAGDGHVAFNPAGSARDSRTRVIELAEQTRIDNLGTFPEFGTLDNVPRHGLSVGISTIADLSKSAIMIITSAEKRIAFDRIAAATGYDPSWPATVIADCRRPLIVADAAAAGA